MKSLARAPRVSLPLLAVAALGGACATAPIAPIPLPLPETLAWASGAESSAGGAFLGLKTRENLAGSFDDLDFPDGVRVTRVVENSPATEAGVRAGDVVLTADGRATDDPGTLAALLRGAAAGDAWTLEIQRGDTVFSVPVTLDAPTKTMTSTGSGVGEAAAGPEVRALYRLDPARSRAGWLTGRGGVVLVSAADASPFVRAGVAVGSIVTAIDGEPVLSDQALIRKLQTYAPGTRVEVDARGREGGERRTVSVRLQDEPTRITDLSIPVLGGYRAAADGSQSSLVLLDLWIISLFRYERMGDERRWRILRFIEFATGIGELAE